MSADSIVSTVANSTSVTYLRTRKMPGPASQPSFVRELIPQWRAAEAVLGKDASELVNSIAGLALNSNPRQVKRFINSLLVISRILALKGVEANLETLGATIGLQLGWPDAAQDFQEAVLAGDERPQAVLERDEGDPDLHAYVARFFAEVDVVHLRHTIQLTGIVATEDIQERLDEPLAADRANKLERFLQSIWNLGFRQSPRSARLYYQPSMPDVRFVVAKHVVRFEKKDGEAWRLWESYLMTRELHLALQVIEEPNKHFTRRV